MRIAIEPEAPGEARRTARRRARCAEPAAARTDAATARSPDYESLLESVYDAVVITDERGIVADFNSRAVEFLAGSGADLHGACVLRYISGAEPDLIESILGNLRNHRFTLIEASCVRTDKSMFPAEIAVNRVGIGAERQLCFFIRDISVRKQAEAAREEAMARLEEADRARIQFVANVSHELRTPLTSMIYAVANLLRGVAGPITGKVREYLDMLDGDCKRLRGTVEDILDLRRIETGTLSLTRTKAPLVRLVRRAADSLRIQATHKHVTLTVDATNEHCFVLCDLQKMERVVMNIVGNAIKFTPEHGRITVRVFPEEPEGSTAQLSVEDTGTGIPPHEIDKVTMRYYTVGTQPSGAGLGLAIAKEIVEMHGGSLSIESPTAGLSHGTCVRIRLPIVDPGVVLLASSDAARRDRMSSLLVRHGYRVTACPGVSCVTESIGANVPDVLVLDCVNAEQDVRALLPRLRCERRTMRTPAIALARHAVDGETSAILRSFSIPLLIGEADADDMVDAIGGLFFSRNGAGSSAVLRLDA